MTEHPPIMNPTPDNPDWAGLAHAPADAVSLAALADAVPDAMTGSALVDAIVASEKALSFLAAKQMRLLTAFAQPFKAGDPMRLARRLARKNCITGDDDPDHVALFVDEAARSLAAGGGRGRVTDPQQNRRRPRPGGHHHDRGARPHTGTRCRPGCWTAGRPESSPNTAHPCPPTTPRRCRTWCSPPPVT